MSGMSKFSIAIGNLVKRPATQRYPLQKREPFANTRGNVFIDISKCNFCGLCQKRCPTHAITVSKPEGTWTIDRLKCIVCANCSDLCAKKSLRIEGQYSNVVQGDAKASSSDTTTRPPAPAAPASSAAPAGNAAPASGVAPAQDPASAPAGSTTPANNT